MDKNEEKIFNKGERFIPGVTHDEAEGRRHINRYKFFRKIIQNDITNNNIKGDIKILDLGCSVGYGCKILSSIPNVFITGIDISKEAIEYSKKNYTGVNISYHISDIRDYVSKMESFDFVVSSGVIEHIEDGFELIKDVKFKRKMMISTPYKEKPGNVYHILLSINENMYNFFSNKKFYYDDVYGNIFNRRVKIIRDIIYRNLLSRTINKLLFKKQTKPLSLICIISK